MLRLETIQLEFIREEENSRVESLLKDYRINNNRGCGDSSHEEPFNL